MSQPIRRQSGVYYSNVRVPADLMTTVPGTQITLPLSGGFALVKATDKVVLSLRTKDGSAAKKLHASVLAALLQHWEAVRAGPKPLTYKQIVALAGEVYRRFAVPLEDCFDPDHRAARREERAQALHAWRYGDGDDGPNGDGSAEISDEAARFNEAIQRPFGVQLLAFETKADVASDFVSMSYKKAIEELFGAEADAICREHLLVLDATTRAKLIREIAEAFRRLADRAGQFAEGDFSPDANLDRFPAFEGPPARPVTPKSKKLTVAVLFDRWKAFNADKKAPATIRRYGPSIVSLATFMGARDVRQISKTDIEGWADHRRDVEGITPTTINRNDLVAAASLFNFATSRESDADADGIKRALRDDNPVRGVKLHKPKQQQPREKGFLLDEIAAILVLARSVVTVPAYPKASASRRFAPFICAYSGARIQEVVWLQKENIWNEGGIFVMRFPVTKDGFARTVPLHDALIDEGFLDYWEAAAPGPLFTGDRPQKLGASKSPAEQRASEIAAWISSHVELHPIVSPNHGWRHTFVTLAQSTAVGMTTEMASAIVGHNRRKDAHRGYFAPPAKEMKRELDRYPRYDLSVVTTTVHNARSSADTNRQIDASSRSFDAF